MYFFLVFQYPQEYGGPSLVSTPSLLYRLIPNRRGAVVGFGQAPERGGGQSKCLIDDSLLTNNLKGDGGRGLDGGLLLGRRHAWGNGQRLGN